MKDPIVVIVGQTASGKSALGMKLAKQYQGEIVCADSRTVYRSMDIGTAKPTQQDQKEVRHFGLDLINPNEYYSAAAFQSYARATIKDIQKRGKLPIMVGGTGLYVDGYLYDFSFGAEPNTQTRVKFESMSLEELQDRAVKLGIGREQIDFANHRHLSRAVERGGVTPTRNALSSNVLLLGLQIDAEQLKERIKTRVDTMFESGLEEEVQNVINLYGAEATGLLTPGYKAMRSYIEGSISLEEAKTLFIRNDWYLAKRQMTWFKRNPDIRWCASEHQANDYVRAFLH